MNFGRLYLPFAAGYLLSYFYRTINAVIAPDLTRELALPAASLGLLTSAYFLAFGAAQVPVGMLLDRYGPRRVEPALLAIAATGAFAFAAADDPGSLAVARAAIGLGVAACLMAPLKAIATWFSRERQASLAGWMMVAGGLGALAATAPLETVLRFTGWRSVFVALGFATLAAAAAIALLVPDLPKPARSARIGEQWSGVKRVFAHPRFWWIAPLAGCAMGTFMAVQGLWAVPWLIEVEGLARAEAARHLLVMGAAILGGYLFVGAASARLAVRGIHARHLFAIGFAISALGLAAIEAGAPARMLWWSVYGLGTAVNVLGFTVLVEGFPAEMSARANTSLNLLMFGCSFAAQWGIGLVVDAARIAAGFDAARGLRFAFALVLAADVLALLWYARGFRRHASPAGSTAAAPSR